MLIAGCIEVSEGNKTILEYSLPSVSHERQKIYQEILKKTKKIISVVEVNGKLIVFATK